MVTLTISINGELLTVEYRPEEPSPQADEIPAEEYLHCLERELNEEERIEALEAVYSALRS